MDGATPRPRPLVSLGDHWYAWTEGLEAGSALRVHAVEHADGRFHLDALEFEGEVTAALLRRLPVGRIEAAVNALAHAGDGPRWRAEARVPDHLRETAVRGYPDEFYEVVARAYRSLSALSPRPVAELAVANDVPLTTAQRWIKEARSRGLLPPGRRGKAG